jgi:hypothetical protein
MEFEDMLKLVQFPDTMRMKFGSSFMEDFSSDILQIKNINHEDIKNDIWSYLLHDDYVVIDLFFERYCRSREREVYERL